MYKDEMIQLHQFLVYVLKYLAEDDQITNDCSEYITLKKYLTDNVILSNVYLTTKGELDYPKVPYSCVEIYVRSQKDADKLKEDLELFP